MDVFESVVVHLDLMPCAFFDSQQSMKNTAHAQLQKSVSNISLVQKTKKKNRYSRVSAFSHSQCQAAIACTLYTWGPVFFILIETVWEGQELWEERGWMTCSKGPPVGFKHGQLQLGLSLHSTCSTGWTTEVPWLRIILISLCASHKYTDTMFMYNGGGGHTLAKLFRENTWIGENWKLQKQNLPWHWGHTLHAHTQPSVFVFVDVCVGVWLCKKEITNTGARKRLGFASGVCSLKTK